VSAALAAWRERALRNVRALISETVRARADLLPGPDAEDLDRALEMQRAALYEIASIEPSASPPRRTVEDAVARARAWNTAAAEIIGQRREASPS